MASKKGKIATVIIILLIVLGSIGIFLTLRGDKGSGAQSGAAGTATGMPGGGPPAGGPPAGGAPQGGGPGGAPSDEGNTGANATAAVRGGTTSRTDTTRTAVRVQTLERGTVSRYVKTNGDVLPAAEVEMYSDVSGRIVRYLVEEGDKVQAGEVLATVDPSRPGESYSASPVTAAIGGTVTAVSYTRGDTISTQTPVATVSDLSFLKIETSIPERYVGKLRKGLSADIELEAFPGEIFQGEILSLDSTLDTASRTLGVELRITSHDQRIKAGMFADIKLYIEQRNDVPIVPLEAVTDYREQETAFVVNQENTAERRVLTLGLEGEDYVEVVSGIELGEMVVIQGQNFLGDGDPVRIVE